MLQEFLTSSQDMSIIRNRYIKGDYYSYTGREKINNLIYPIPERDGLGIHVTIDLSGQIKFGPSAYPVKEIDYSLDLSRKSKFLKSIKSYWPNIRSELIQPKL